MTKTLKTYSLITTITAHSSVYAEDARAEMVCALEDSRGSSFLPDGVDIAVGDLVEKDLDEVLTFYRAFHDKLSDMIEDGLFIGFKEAHPADYQWMVGMMVQTAELDQKDGTK